MWIECSELLSNALKECITEIGQPDLLLDASCKDLEQLVQDPGLERISDRVLDLPQDPLYSPPFLGTPLCFALGKVLKGHGGYGPQALGERLLRFLEGSAAGKYQFSLARGGYLNVSYRRGLELEYTKTLLASPNKHRLEVDWPAVESRVSEFAKQFDAEDSQAYLALLQGPITDDVRLMQLGVLADVELDPICFLRGMHGKQNLPWFFRHFQEDLDCLEREIREPSNIKSFPEERLLQGLIGSASEALIWIEYEHQQAQRMKRPESFLRSVCKLIDIFYASFHRPDFRRGCLVLRPESSLAVEISSLLGFFRTLLGSKAVLPAFLS